jgi:thioredoxin reductase
MTAPVELALVGKVKFGEVKKERLLEFWQGVVDKTGLKVSFSERMEGVDRDADGAYTVRTTKGVFRARAVLLALGRRGSPRKLGVPGEELPKVVYRLVDAEQYRGQQVLVVGGGDSALEAALDLGEQPGTSVTLAYRSDAFSRVKSANRRRLEARQADGRIEVLMNTEVDRIGAGDVVLRTGTAPLRTLPNDAVIVCAGGLLPTPLLQAMGINFDTKFGTA